MATEKIVCSIEGCNRRSYGNGLCDKHWQRFAHRKRRQKVLPNPCGTEMCLLKDPFGECCARFYQRSRTNDGGEVYTYWSDTKTTARERFWAQVAITADDQRCWNWTGLKTPYGYGIFSIHHDQNLAHRMAWFFITGEKPSQWILHKNECHNTSCVNPNHLYDGTPKDNALDRIIDGTQPRGETHGMARIRDEDALQVKQLLAEGLARKVVVEMTGIAKTTVDSIARGEHWQHV